MKRILLFLLTIIGLSTSLSEPAAILPYFKVDNAGTSVTTQTGPTAGSLLWSANYVVSSPIFIDGDNNLYFIAQYASPSLMYSITSIDSQGAARWSYSYGTTTTLAAIDDSGNVYAGNDIFLYFFDSSGNPGWHYETDGEPFSSAKIDSVGNVYFSSTDDKVYCVNSVGDLVWSYQTGNDANSPILDASGLVYFGSWDNNFYCLNSDGTLVWSYPAGSAVQTEAAYSANDFVYFGSNDGKYYCLNSDGTLVWSFQTSSWAVSCPAVNTGEEIIFGGNADDKIYCLNSNGTVLWSLPTGGRDYASPIIDASGNIYVGSSNNNVYCLNSDGTILWTYTTDYDVVLPVAIDSQERAYFGNSKLYAIGATFTPTSTSTPTQTPTASPTQISMYGIVPVGYVRADADWKQRVTWAAPKLCDTCDFNIVCILWSRNNTGDYWESRSVDVRAGDMLIWDIVNNDIPPIETSDINTNINTWADTSASGILIYKMKMYDYAQMMGMFIELYSLNNLFYAEQTEIRNPEYAGVNRYTYYLPATSKISSPEVYMSQIIQTHVPKTPTPTSTFTGTPTRTPTLTPTLTPTRTPTATP